MEDAQAGKKHRLEDAEANSSSEKRMRVTSEDKENDLSTSTSSSKGKKNVSSSKKPKKPRSAYIIFGVEIREKIKSENPGINAKDIMKMTGAEWKKLSDEEKRPYKKKAEDDKARFERESATYVPTPEDLAAEEAKKNRRKKKKEKDAKRTSCSSSSSSAKKRKSSEEDQSAIKSSSEVTSTSKKRKTKKAKTPVQDDKQKSLFSFFKKSSNPVKPNFEKLPKRKDPTDFAEEEKMEAEMRKRKETENDEQAEEKVEGKEETLSEIASEVAPRESRKSRGVKKREDSMAALRAARAAKKASKNSSISEKIAEAGISNLIGSTKDGDKDGLVGDKFINLQTTHRLTEFFDAAGKSESEDPCVEMEISERKKSNSERVTKIILESDDDEGDNKSVVEKKESGDNAVVGAESSSSISEEKTSMMTKKVGAIGPAWTRGEIEAPKGEKNMGTWTKSYYTQEQQERLGVDEDGKKKEMTTSLDKETTGSPIDEASSSLDAVCDADAAFAKQKLLEKKEEKSEKGEEKKNTPVHSFFAPRSASKQKSKKVKSSTTGKATATQAASSSSTSVTKQKASSSVSSLSATNSDSKSTSSSPLHTQDGLPYRTITDVFVKIEATTKRLEIIQMLQSLFETCLKTFPDDLVPLVYLASNQLAPRFENIELGIGDSIIMKMIVEMTGSTASAIKKAYEDCGDLGKVAEAKRNRQKTLAFGRKRKTLLARNVFRIFKEIAFVKGSKSQDRKIRLMKKLMLDAQGSEPKYLVRALQGKLRMGLGEQTVVCALAYALASVEEEKKRSKENDNFLKGVLLTDEVKKQSKDMIDQVYSECPSFDLLIPAAVKHGWRNLHKNCHLVQGTPVKPMLAKPTKGVVEVLQRFTGKKFTCEYKYDGERAQIHVGSDGSVRVFSRNLEDNTTKFPDIISIMPDVLSDGVTSIIIDSEVVAYDVEKQCLQPFQTLSHRKRKDVNVEDIKVKVVVLAFDLLLLNGESYLQRTLEDRRAAMKQALKATKGKLEFAVSMESDDVEKIQDFLDESVKAGCEGLMVKSLTEDATYTPSKRTFNWLKLKKDYVDGLGDTLDLVCIGAWKGRGKRTGVYGAFLLACYDADEEAYQSVCKLGTGFSDEVLAKLAKQLPPEIVATKPQNFQVSTTIKPDVWFNPTFVWEVKAADLSISPVHTAASNLSEDGKGIALRFPRFLGSREDKNPEDATSAEQVLEMFNNQDVIQMQN
eukprot:g2933.t1